jgi:hypothetical protein
MCASLRFTGMWNDPRDVAAALTWDSVVGAAPEQRAAQPNQRTAFEGGVIFDGLAALEMRASPGRVDWLLGPPASQAALERTDLPNIGAVGDILPRFATLLFAKAAAAYDAGRFALGIVALHAAPSKDSSYAELGRLLPAVAPALENASEFLFQVNRPRLSSTVPDLQLNRLSRWSSSALVGFRIVMPAMGGPATHTNADPLTATRVEIDVSTPADPNTAIAQGVRVPLFEEMCELGLEILNRGDVP